MDRISSIATPWNLWLYFSDSKLYARRQILRIRNKPKILNSSKYSGKIVDEIGIPVIREWIEGNYRIICTILNENEICSLTIHHSSQDLTNRKIEWTHDNNALVVQIP